MDNLVALSMPILAEVNSLGQLPRPMSTLANEIDWIYMFVFWVSVIFFVPIVGLMIYFCVKYRRRSDSDPMPVGPTHNTLLEITWTAIPMVLVCFMFYYGVAHYAVMATPPNDAYRVEVTAAQWNWRFTYPNPDGGGQVEANEFHTYVGQPFSLKMQSQDVIHAFYCPEMRTKRDIVPGRTDYVWFEPTGPGEFWIFCTEYCGTSHSQMISKLHVHASRAAFEEALRKLDKLPGGETWEKGLVLWERGGCKQCHSLDGAPATGANWMDLSQQWKVSDPQNPLLGEWSGEKRTVKVAGGQIEQVLLDDNYIHESIMSPASKIVVPYESLMPASPRFLTDPKRPENIGFVTDLIRVLKTMPALKRGADPNWSWEAHLQAVKARGPEADTKPR